MKRGKYQTKTPGYEDWVASKEYCDFCGERFLMGSWTEVHHVKTPRSRWKVAKFDISLRATKVHKRCHDLMHSDREAMQRGPEMVRENLLEKYGDCLLSDKLTEAGWLDSP